MATELNEIKRSLIHKILAGLYPDGSILPSCRSLASELGINRNTANKLYQELEREGLVRAIRGQGFMVVAQPTSGSALTSMLREHVLAAVREAKLLGVSRQAFLQTVLEVTDSLFERRQPAVALVECNEEDASSLAGEIAARLSVPVQPILLSAVELSADTVAADYDLVCSPLYHLPEVINALAAIKDKVVAVHAAPDVEILNEIARLPAQTRIGIVCERPTTQQYLVSAIALVHRGQLQSCLLTQKEALWQMAETIDVLVDVPSCHKEVARLFPALPILTMRFRIDGQSLEPLRRLLDGVRRQDLLFPVDKAQDERYDSHVS